MKKVTLFFVLLAFLTICYAQNFPNTPAGKRAKELVELLNGTGSHNLDDYIQNHFAPQLRDAFPIEGHKDAFQRVHDNHGILELAAVKSSDTYSLQVVLKARNREAWLNMTVQVETDEPYKITLLGFRPGTNPAESKKEDSPASLEELHSYLKKKTEENEFSGTILIAKDFKPIFKNAYGYAYKAFKVPNQMNTKFNLASIGKLFTSIAIIQLMQQGKLSIDDPIGKYLDIFPQDISKKVKIRHLLNQQSGWGDYWNNTYFQAHWDRLRTVSDYMVFVKDMPLDFEPGTNTQHSNTGFLVAGAIIEAVSGMEYNEYLEKNIYGPAGMTNTSCFHRDGPVENLAVGYTNMNPFDTIKKDFKWTTIAMLPMRGTASGGGYSTAEDLLKLDVALRSHKLLNSEYTNFLLRRFIGSPSDSSSTPARMLAWAGGAPGTSTFLGMDFKSSYTIIVLSNYDHPKGLDVARHIQNILKIEGI